MTTVKEKYSAEERERIEEARTRLLAVKDERKLSWNQLFQRTGIAESTMQAFAAGKYNGNMAKIADEVLNWVRADEMLSLFVDYTDWAPDFVPTKTSRRIESMLTMARNNSMVLIMGDPGVGKTATLRNHVQANQKNTWMVTASPSRSTPHEILQTILTAIKVPAGKRNIFNMSQLVRAHFAARQKCLLIVDEAQSLNEKALEELRAIFDDEETHVGIAFVGNREVSRNIDGNRTAQYAQRWSRIAMRHIIALPEAEDVKAVLAAWGIENERELKFLSGIALKPGGGGLRSLTKCLELAGILARDMDNNADRSLVHLQDAWAQLSAGSMA